jgi:hypothetical protein
MTAQERDRIRAQIVASRRAQGLRDSVPASRFLAELAAEVLAEEIKEAAA